MAPSEQAQKTHDELFPNHVSTLVVTDPELIETFDNFAFDEVLSGSTCVNHCVPGSARVPSHAQGGAHRWGHSHRGQGGL
jgi:hypothetical protein